MSTTIVKSAARIAAEKFRETLHSELIEKNYYEKTRGYGDIIMEHLQPNGVSTTVSLFIDPFDAEPVLNIVKSTYNANQTLVGGSININVSNEVELRRVASLV